MTTNQIIADKIGSLLVDKNIGFLVKDGQLEGEIEEFAGLVTISYLFKEIYPLLKQIK